MILDLKCPSYNESYAGRHWTARKEEADLIHSLVIAAVRRDKIKPITQFPVDIQIIAYYKHKIRHDSCNVSDKEIIDGLVMAKILPDDSTPYVRWCSTLAIIGAEEDFTEVLINRGVMM